MFEARSLGLEEKGINLAVLEEGIKVALGRRRFHFYFVYTLAICVLLMEKQYSTFECFRFHVPVYASNVSNVSLEMFSLK